MSFWNDDARKEELARPFPEEWIAFLHRNVAHFQVLSAEQRAKLQDDLRVLVAEKFWEGCGGLRMTDEIKVTIAAQACLLLLGHEHDYFGRVKSILVYPSEFLVPSGPWMDQLDDAHALSGQAWHRGPVILAWDIVLETGRDPSMGENLVVHEFAHQLDFLDGMSGGIPALSDPELAMRWHEIMREEFARLRRQVRKGKEPFLSDYASENEAEFFAMASERFFTVPQWLQHYHARLYEALSEYYAIDPISWFASESDHRQDDQDSGGQEV